MLFKKEGISQARKPNALRGSKDLGVLLITAGLLALPGCSLADTPEKAVGTPNQQLASTGSANYSRQTYYFSLENHPYPDTLLRVFPSDGGLHLLFDNPDAANAQHTLREIKYVKSINSIEFDIYVKSQTSASVFTGFITPNHANESRWQSSPLLSSDMTPGLHHISLSIDRFTHDGHAPSPADTTNAFAFYLGVTGASTTADITITRFTVDTDAGSFRIFDPLEAPQPFSPSIEPSQPNLFPPDQTPRVFLPGGMANFGDPNWTDIILDDFNTEFKGHLGLDIGMYQTPETRKFIALMNAHGIKTMSEAHKAGFFFATYLVANDAYLTRVDGKKMWEVAPAPPPFHGEDISRAEVVDSANKITDEFASEGLSDFLLIDYVWPWEGGPWWTSPHMNQAFRDDLNSADTGLYLSDSKSQYHKTTFWQYLATWTDLPYTPASVGLASWSDYTLTPPSASNGATDQARRNQFLFDALYHYEYLKYLGLLGDHAQSKGVTFYPSTNAENIFNGGDMRGIAELRGVGKLSYEFFGCPPSAAGIYHTLRWYSSAIKSNGKAIQFCGQIGPGGHGASEMDPDTTYAFTYEVTSAGKPVDYNNQYLENYWRNIPDAYTRERFFCWYAGAEAFMLSHKESPELQPAKDTVLVASRSVLEPVREFIENITLDRNGCLANLLDKDHFAFDACGKEGLKDRASAAKVLVYCPAESSPMHLRWLNDWIHSGSGKTLITHSFIPIHVFNGEFGDTPEDGGELSLDAAKSRLVGEGVKPTEIVVPVTGIVRKAKVEWNRLSANVDIYTTSGGTVVADSRGLPLITEFSIGGNKIVYINVCLTGDDDPFTRGLINRAMDLAGQKPEAIAPAGSVVHLYAIPGGRSCVVWDRATVDSQAPHDRYDRVALPQAVDVAVPVLNPNLDYDVYNLFDDNLKQLRSDSSARIHLSSGHSCDIFYVGRSSDPAFAATLAGAQAVRLRMSQAVLVRGMPTPDAVAKAIEYTPEEQNELTALGTGSGDQGTIDASKKVAPPAAVNTFSIKLAYPYKHTDTNGVAPYWSVRAPVPSGAAGCDTLQFDLLIQSASPTADLSVYLFDENDNRWLASGLTVGKMAVGSWQHYTFNRAQLSPWMMDNKKPLDWNGMRGIAIEPNNGKSVVYISNVKLTGPNGTSLPILACSLR